MSTDTHKRRRSTRDPEPSSEENTAHQREQDLRRARGEISCAECHRLKLRCDRKIPCSACIRRGRPGLCPNGISNGPAARFPLADTEMYRKLCEMSERIRQLEEALETFQTAHPLLQKDLLDVKSVSGASCSTTKELTDEKEMVDAFGTLAIYDRGLTRFLGRQGGAESILLASDGAPLDYTYCRGDVSMPPLITKMAESFPFSTTNLPTADLLDLMETYLPSRDRATTLCETYLEHCTWVMRPVCRLQLFSELIPSIYTRKTAVSGTSSDTSSASSPSAAARSSGSESSVYPDELALLFMVFAVGALTDLTLPEYNDEAERYYQVGRSALGLADAFEQPSLVVIQAVALMAGYMSLSGRRYTLDASCLTIKLATNIAKCSGLHRDPAKWGLDAKTVDRRRALFWDLQTFDGVIGGVVGAAPSMTKSHWDCELPEDRDQHVSEDGTVEPGYWAIRYKYSKEIVYEINMLTSEATPTKYSEILAIDRKVREFHMPAYLTTLGDPNDWESEGPRTVMARFMTSVVRDISMVILHRTYFAKALLEHPINPLRSRYFHSFITAYRSSMNVLKMIRTSFEHYPRLLTRYWSMWTHAFAAIMIVGSVVIRGPNSNLALTAITELGLSVQMFERADLQSVRGKRVMPVLRRVREKAYQAYNRARNSRAPLNSRNDLSLKLEIKEEEDDWAKELAILGGKTQVLETKDVMRPRSPSRQSPAGQTSPPSRSTGHSPLDPLMWSDSNGSLPAFNNAPQSYIPGEDTLPPIGPGVSLATHPPPFFDNSITAPFDPEMFQALQNQNQSSSSLINQSLDSSQQTTPLSANFFDFGQPGAAQMQGNTGYPSAMPQFPEDADPLALWLAQQQQLQPQLSVSGYNTTAGSPGQTAEQAWVSLIQDSGCLEDEWPLFYKQ